jgi:disulfide bond formation protein DsbB
MSHHNRNVLNANLVAIILVINFIIIGGLILANQMPEMSGNGQSTEVALVEPTVTVLPSPTSVPTNTPTNVPVPSATPTVLSVPEATATPLVVADAAQTNGQVAANSYDPAVVSKGEQLFMVCSACHGADARGLPKLGKNLVDSTFIAGLTDEKFLEFVKTGRPIWDALNTTGIDMPPKGGNPAFTDDDLLAIIAYLRTLRSASTGAAPEATTEAPVASNAGATNVQSTANTYDAALVSKGEQLFMVCSACHGADARGLPKLGKNLVESTFIAGLTDEKFLEFVKTGRPIWDALNTTGIDMPPKGGNPAFTDDDLLAIIAYIRTLAAQGS